MELDQKPTMKDALEIVDMRALKLLSLAFISMKLNIKNYLFKTIHSGAVYNHCRYLSTSFIFLSSVSLTLYFLSIFLARSHFLQLQSNFLMSIQCIFYYSDGTIYHANSVLVSLLKKDTS